MNVYQGSPLKRHTATKAEMQIRADFLVAYAKKHGPVTVRGLYYQAEVAGIPGIDKTESGYNKVQAQVLALRRAGKMLYSCISDATRYMRKPQTFDGWEKALQDCARFYRKDLWAETRLEVEIWIEKSALSGVIHPVTCEYDVPLMPTGGFTSETFAYEAVAGLNGAGKTLVVYALYDFDRSGRDASRSLQDKVERFGAEYDVPVQFNNLGLLLEQVQAMNLPTRPPKRKTTADQRWPYEFAAELDAIQPDDLRQIVREAIEQHLPSGQLAMLQRIEVAERQTLMQFIEREE